MKLALPGSLLALAALLVAATGYELLAPLGPITVEAPRAPVLRATTPVAQVAPPSIELFADIDARPLFSPQRAPLPDRLAGSASGSPSDLVLIGVMIGGEKPIALFKSAGTSTTTTATVGDMVGGWRVVDIAPTRVGLRGASGLIEIPLASLGSQTPSAPLPAPTSDEQAEPAPAAPAAPAALPAASSPSASAPQVQVHAAPPAKPSSLATVSAPVAVTVSAKPALQARSANGTIAPEALKGAPVNPKTGEPTL
jgi:hypothetical protein